jgi:hypothetical protein
MGLDVNLKYSQNREQALANQRRCEEYSSELWEEAGSYDGLTDEQKTAIRDRATEFNATLNCNDWGNSNDIDDIELDSTTDPDNMFKIGYLRSSYNESGVNNVLRRINTLDLYGIFGVTDGHEYYITPDWHACLERVNQVIADIKMHMEGPMALYDAIHVRNYLNEGVATAAEALALLEAELETHQPNSSFSDYGNAKGEWFLDGIKVVGVVPAKKYGGGAFLLTKSEKSNLDWYFKAILITREMIEHVLAQPDPDNYFLSWSA